MKPHDRFSFPLLALTVSALLLGSPLSVNARARVVKSLPASPSAEDQGPSRIPFELTDGGHVLVRVSINGSEPLWFGLDSGNEQTLISRRQAKALNLKLRAEGQAAGSGENLVDFALVKNVSFNLSGVKFVLGEIGVLPLELSSASNPAIVGLLGYDFISRFVVEVDYDAHVMTLYRPRGYRYRGRGEIIPVRMMDNNPHVRVRVVLPGLAPLTGMFVIDSGDGGTDLEFYSPFVRNRKLLDSTQQMREAAVEGIGGRSGIRIGKATNLRIGRLTIQNPVVFFSTASQGANAGDIGAGVIGANLLRRFKKVIYDQTRHRMILEERRNGQD
jgi:Aspartyl protease